MKKAKLILESGEELNGLTFGADTDTLGEVVFNTSMTGYQEILTDPSYCGQMVTMTYPMIGNYGINRDDFESLRPACKALIVREYCLVPSNFRSQHTLHEYLCKMGIPGLAEIDTRRLTKIIRSQGTCKALILRDDSPHKQELLAQLHKPLPQDEVAQVSTKTAFTLPGQGARIVLIDFGYKKGIVKELLARGCHITVVPFNVTSQEIHDLSPDGLVLSNGPGNPEVLTRSIATIQEVQKTYPLMGICMGHQVFALANGAKTSKMKFGHRGANHPVKDLSSGKVFLSSQNHGYQVLAESLEQTSLDVAYVNVNDDTVEGLRHQDYPAFSVQFHPEASPGPEDTAFLFDQFLQQLRTNHA